MIKKRKKDLNHQSKMFKKIINSIFLKLILGSQLNNKNIKK